MNIVIEYGAWQSALPDYESVIVKALSFTADDMSVVLADDGYVQSLNKQFRGKDKPTNILSFPDDSEEGYAGDMILAFETIEREAIEQCKALADHLTHLLIHGALHLQGYDHVSHVQATEMESYEIALLAKLGIANPYESD